MKRYIILILLVPLLLSSCLRNLEKEGIKAETTYKGRVIDAHNKPLNGIMVRITNGSLIYNSVATDKDGIFQITVDISKIDKSYYIQVGEIGSLVKRSSLKGFGQDVYDYGDIPFVNINLPEVLTLELTDVSVNSFTCQCEVKSQGGAMVTERGICWSSSIPTINDNIIQSGVGEGIYSCSITSPYLDFNIMTIYACAYAINEYGVSYGTLFKINFEELQRFMKVKLPTVETVGLTAMTETSFTCKGNVASQGKAIVTERGICWATNIPTIDNNIVPFGGGEGVYSCTVTGLNFNNTTYYARAYAINEYGVSYGEPVEVNSSKMAYLSLPTMEFGGYTYHIHPDIGGMQWKQGYEACNNLVAYGYDDWFMPNKEEMLGLADLDNILDKDIIYWTSSANDDYTNRYYYLQFIDSYWNVRYSYITYILHVIPVRRDR